MKSIPSHIIDIAENEGCNHVEFAGNLDSQEVYCISELGDDGFFVPRGLPTLVLWDGETYSIVTGEKSLELLSRLY